MRKYLSIHYILPAVLLIAFIFGMTLYFTGKNQDTITTSSEAAPVSNIATETPAHTVELISEVPGFEPAPGQPIRDELVRILDEIHFWDGVYTDKGSNDDMKKFDRLRIKLTPHIQTNDDYYITSEDEPPIMNSRLYFEDRVLHLDLYVANKNVTTNQIRSYLLSRLYRASVWPRQYHTDENLFHQRVSLFVNAVDPMINIFYRK